MTPNTRTLKGQSYCSQRWANPAWPKGSKSRGFSRGQRLNLPKFGFSGDNEKLQNLKGGVGSLTLGILFALAFCPTSGIFYFGLLIPMAAISTGGMWFSVVFAVATALPVAVVAWLLAYSIAGIGRFYNRLQVFERWMRRIVGWLFTGTGLYYLIRLL